MGYSAFQNTSDAWYRLRLFNYYRGALSLFFVIIYLNGWFSQLVQSSRAQPEVFFTTSILYLITSLAFSASINRQKPSIQKQVFIQTIIDIICITIMMHATGGFRTGLGMLLIINVSMTSLFIQQRLTLFFAAVATLAVIGEQVYSQLNDILYSPTYTQAGLLGILIFTSAYLSGYTAKRLRESEQFAEQTSAELESIVQMNEHIIKSMRTGIMVIKNDGTILMANNAALELLGNITIDSSTRLQQISNGLHERFTDWNNHDVQNHQPIQQPKGLPDLQPGFSRINRNHTDDNQSGRSLIFLEDATQLAQRFQQVKLASLGRLTASIAHEIRNPLAAISHAGQLLDESSCDEGDHKLTGIINTQAKRLNNIVENVLQLSRQQQGTPETIDLHAWLLQFREEFVSTNKLHDYQIRINILPQDIKVLFDSSQLHQVFWNLCSNALNHSKMDNVNIMINIHGEIDDTLNQVYIDIIDNGPGIDDETLSHVFEPFFTTSTSGTGLGLYITKEVIESNRAKIRHISPATGGTCFRIFFQQP